MIRMVYLDLVYMKIFLVVIAGVFSFIYLINPTSGLVEFIPDNIPLIGNFDEAVATALLLSSLAYFGIDFSHLFTRDQKIEKSVKDTEV